MQKLSKRLISALVSVFVVLSVLPFAASAAIDTSSFAVVSISTNKPLDSVRWNETLIYTIVTKPDATRVKIAYPNGELYAFADIQQGFTNYRDSSGARTWTITKRNQWVGAREYRVFAGTGAAYDADYKELKCSGLGGTEIIVNPDPEPEFAHDYGVFLNYEGSLDRFADYKTIVIDAQYITKSSIESFKAKGHTVYSYINVGALENFRDYYDEYKDLALGNYEHWDEEVWINVADTRWQNFMASLASQLLAKGIDGFFVDNCDVYYNYERSDILNGLTVIMKNLRKNNTPVLINSGDMFLDAYCRKAGTSPLDVVTGINQETVFSSIDWDNETFGRADEEDKGYFIDYITRYAAKGVDIYLLEYTRDSQLAAEIVDYCNAHGFHYYISSTLELLAE